MRPTTTRPGLDLLRSKMTLRRRTGGPDAGWHLKLPAVQGARTEVGLPLSAGDPGDVPSELAGLVRGAARGRELVPVARLVNDRTVRHLHDAAGTTLIEVADDHVTATPLLTGATKPSQWRELEAEIIKGTRDQLAATVDVLISAGASKASSASKLARALAFEPTPARRSKSAGTVVLSALGRQRDWLIVADRGIREGADAAPGALHDARSAARRIRAMITVYAPLFEGDTIPALRTALREFGSTLSNARDLEVAHRTAGRATRRRAAGVRRGGAQAIGRCLRTQVDRGADRGARAHRFSRVPADAARSGHADRRMRRCPDGGTGLRSPSFRHSSVQVGNVCGIRPIPR